MVRLSIEPSVCDASITLKYDPKYPATMNNDNLYDLLASGFAEDHRAPCLITTQGHRWSWSDMQAESARYAHLLKAQGAAPGERVAVQVDKSAQALALYLACLRVGAIYLPLNPAYPERELDHFLSDAEPAVVVGRPLFLDALRPLCEKYKVRSLLGLGADGEGSLIEQSRSLPRDFTTSPRKGDDPAALLYTSGTTGRPKGAMLTHANLSSNARTLHAAWGFRADDVLLHALPIFHVHGLFVACNTSLLNGSAMLFFPDFDATRICRALPQATIFMGVPTYYTRLLAREELTVSLCRGMRLFISGSAPLLEQTFLAFQQRSGHRILERYGMTECGMSTSNPLEGERRAGTVGRPLPGVDLRIVDDEGRRLAAGEVGGIEFKGPNVFSGYWRMPEASAKEFTADGYFRSGDLGYVDDDGYITIVGRSKDLIISGGLNIHPKEVELLIDRLQGVEESAVIGLPHPDFGEQVCAVIVPSTEAPTLDEGEMIEHLKRDLVNYKVPKRIFFTDSLPRNAMGKVQKNILRERFGADASKTP
ncbi:malonate--CoA ligase [Thioalkalivibrio sp. HK1]|uniref:malonate--CoA ligase n=1 Tax=Thioalkalivibrio sp. HK1 TaxID=1469245 RepID=UPI001E658CEA|nr:malonyl-CoA synthase [Thioalkalivibrio sp. HK1]